MSLCCAAKSHLLDCASFDGGARFGRSKHDSIERDLAGIVQPVPEFLYWHIDINFAEPEAHRPRSE
jgi:hypothetical protein